MLLFLLAQCPALVGPAKSWHHQWSWLTIPQQPSYSTASLICLHMAASASADLAFMPFMTKVPVNYARGN